MLTSARSLPVGVCCCCCCCCSNCYCCCCYCCCYCFLQRPSAISWKRAAKLRWPRTKDGNLPFYSGDDSSDSENEALADGPRVPSAALLPASTTYIGEKVRQPSSGTLCACATDSSSLRVCVCVSTLGCCDFAAPQDDEVFIDPLKVRWVFLARSPRMLGGVVQPIAEAKIDTNVWRPVTALPCSRASLSQRLVLCQVVRWDRLPDVAAELELATSYVKSYRSTAAGRSPLHGASRDELKAMALAQFERLGKSKSGLITLEDFEHVLEAVGVKLTSAQTAKYYDAAITDWKVNPLMSLTELHLALCMLGLVQQQTLLLPEDLYFLFDPHKCVSCLLLARVLSVPAFLTPLPPIVSARTQRAIHDYTRGPLDVLSFFCIMNCHGYTMSQKKAREVFRKLDVADNHLIGMEEFLEAWHEQVRSALLEPTRLLEVPDRCLLRMCTHTHTRTHRYPSQRS